MSKPDGVDMLCARGLRRYYGREPAVVRALDGVDLTVARGETVAVMGPSGCGKSTLLRLAVGLVNPDSGLVQVDGRTVGAAGLEANPVCCHHSAVGPGVEDVESPVWTVTTPVAWSSVDESRSTPTSKR